jgi:hypothetical protein
LDSSFQLKWIEGDTTNYPSYGFVKFQSEELIQSVKKSTHIPCKEDLKDLFNLLKNKGISWKIKGDGCDSRADMAYRLLIGSGIPPESLFKQYCFGESLGNHFGCSWNYHVALGILDSEGNKWILDPSVDSENPSSIENWISLVSDAPKYVNKELQDCPFSIDSQVSCTLSCPFDFFASMDFLVKRKIHFEKTKNLGIDLAFATWKIAAFVQKQPLFRALVGEYIQAGLCCWKDDQQKAHDQSCIKMAALAESNLPLSLLPEDIDAIIPENYFFGKKELENIIERVNLLTSSLDKKSKLYSYIYESNVNKLIDAWKESYQEKRTQEKTRLYNNIEICFEKMKQQGFSDNDLLTIKKKWELKKEDFNKLLIFPEKII